jgi:hypothetical protein
VAAAEAAEAATVAAPVAALVVRILRRKAHSPRGGGVLGFPSYRRDVALRK